MNNSWVSRVMSMNADGPSLSASVTPTSILAATAKWNMPANYLYVGRAFKVRGHGRLSNIVTSPGTLTLDLRLGAIVIFNGGVMNLSTTAHTTLPFSFEIDLVCRAIGASTAANFMGQGLVISQCLSLTSTADSATTPAILPIPNVAPAVGAGFDSTIVDVLDCFATFSVNNAGNLIQLHQFSVDDYN